MAKENADRETRQTDRQARQRDRQTDGDRHARQSDRQADRDSERKKRQEAMSLFRTSFSLSSHTPIASWPIFGRYMSTWNMITSD